MKRETILRRDLLKRIATVGGAAAAWTLGGIIPESRAFAATPSQDSAAARAVKIDAKAERLLALVRSTPEYRNFKSALTSANPVDLWAHGDYQFVSFAVRSVEQLNQADRSPLQILSTLTFAAGRDGVIDVFLLRPEGDGSTSTLASLRGGVTQTVSHSPSVRAKLADARQQAITVRESATAEIAKASLTTASGEVAPGVTAEGCDCGPSRRYFCVYQVCGGGYVDDGCYWLLSLGCTALPTPALRIACAVAARAACYVLPWCSCAQYSCGSCMY